MNICLLVLFMGCITLCAVAKAQPMQDRQCYSMVDTREQIVSNGLSEPFHAMRKTAIRAQAEALAAKLCRWNDDFVYEISLLRRDGRLIRAFVNAKTGQLISSKNED
jgi:uncharacterized membrane protein YkoI